MVCYRGRVMRPQPLRDLMIAVAAKARLAPLPERYMWQGVWWNMHSRETANPRECIQSAKGLLRLAKDMAGRPDYYSQRPASKTDWEWSGLKRCQDRLT